MKVSFEKDIVPILRQFRGPMLWRFDLTKYEDVKGNASEIYDQISTQQMPCLDVHTGCVYNTHRILTLISMSKRINIVLPETTIQTIDRMTKPGQRSRFINQAVQHFVANRSVEALRVQLERAAVRDQDLDREVAADWFAVDHETWQQLDQPKSSGKAAIRGAEKSTSRRSIRR